MLQARVDAFIVAFRGEVSAKARALLEARRLDAAALRTAVAFELGSAAFALHPRSREGWWKAQNADAQLLVQDAEDQAGWRLEVRTSADALAREGPHAALARSRVIAEAILDTPEEERLRRVDLCADLARLDLNVIDPRQWVTPRRTGARAIATIEEYLKAGKRTGFYVGRGDVVFRAYDKIEQLHLDTIGADKREAEFARWREAGWDGAAPVARAEFQIRGAAMKEIDDGRIRDPDVFLERIDAVWSYLSRSWLRLAVVDSATRRTRWTTDRRWRTVQSVRFTHDDGEIASRSRRRQPARARFAFSVAMNYGAWADALSPLPFANGRAHVATWSDERAAQFVRERVPRVLSTLGTAAAEDLITAYGPKGAAAYTIEKENAARARASRIFMERETARREDDERDDRQGDERLEHADAGVGG